MKDLIRLNGKDIDEIKGAAFGPANNDFVYVFGQLSNRTVIDEKGRRKSWPDGEFIAVSYQVEIPVLIRHVKGVNYPWVPNQEDLFATDWILCD